MLGRFFIQGTLGQRQRRWRRWKAAESRHEKQISKERRDNNASENGDAANYERGDGSRCSGIRAQSDLEYLDTFEHEVNAKQEADERNHGAGVYLLLRLKARVVRRKSTHYARLA